MFDGERLTPIVFGMENYFKEKMFFRLEDEFSYKATGKKYPYMNNPSNFIELVISQCMILRKKD